MNRAQSRISTGDEGVIRKEGAAQAAEDASSSRWTGLGLRAKGNDHFEM